jgi:hypothetical protein
MQLLNVLVGVHHIILVKQRAMVGVLSKNFQANHQLDVDLCTEFQYTLYRSKCPLYIVY